MLHALVEQGNTVVVIEHDLEVIKTADYIIDLGPEGGDAGGRIVAAGTPEQVAARRLLHRRLPDPRPRPAARGHQAPSVTIHGSHVSRRPRSENGCQNETQTPRSSTSLPGAQRREIMASAGKGW